MKISEDMVVDDAGKHALKPMLPSRSCAFVYLFNAGKRDILDELSFGCRSCSAKNGSWIHRMNGYFLYDSFE